MSLEPGGDAVTLLKGSELYQIMAFGENEM